MKSKLAKVVVLSENVEVIVKKAIVSGKFGINLTFMADVQDDSITSTGMGMEYSTRTLRDKDFDAFEKTTLKKIASQLPVFKNLI